MKELGARIAKARLWGIAAVAAITNGATYLAFQIMGFQNWRDTYLWIGLAAAPAGLAVLILCKLRKHQGPIYKIGSFMLDWFYMAFIISLIAR